MIGMAVAGEASLPSGLQFVQVGHWVYSSASQSAVHVDGSTGQVDARANVPGAGAGSQVTQGGRSGYVVERSRITEFSKSTLSVESSSTPPAAEEPVVLEVAGGPYLVYRNAGQIVRLGDPAATVPAGGPLSMPVATSDGTVWLHRIDNGAICELPRAATLLACSARLPQGHDGAVAVVGDRPVVVDTTADTLSLVGKDGLGEGADIGINLPTTAQVANDAVDGRLAVADPDRNQLHLIDATGLLKSSPVARPVSIDLPKDGRFGGPVATSHTVVLVDQVHNEVLSYDSDGSLKGRKPVSGPSGSSKPVLGQDGRVYVDSPDGSHVLVVDGKNGSAADVDVDGQSQTQSTGGPPASAPPADVPAGSGPPAVAAQAPVKPTTLPAAPPGAPRNVKASAGAGSATVSWAAATANGARVTGYLVSWSGGSTTVSGSRSNVTVNGLVNGKSYVFTVVAQNSAGRGAGASAKAVVPGRAADAPKVTATVGSGGQVSVSWTAPNLHGATLDHYLVSATGQANKEVSGASTTYQGLSGTVTFTVRAVTRYGQAGSALLTGSTGSTKVTVATGPPTVQITKVRSTSTGLLVTVNADDKGSPATCQATFLNASTGWVPCDGVTDIPINNVAWFGAITITVTIKNSVGTAQDSWTGTPQVSG